MCARHSRHKTICIEMTCSSESDVDMRDKMLLKNNISFLQGMLDFSMQMASVPTATVCGYRLIKASSSCLTCVTYRPCHNTQQCPSDKEDFSSAMLTLSLLFSQERRLNARPVNSHNHLFDVIDIIS